MKRVFWQINSKENEKKTLRKEMTKCSRMMLFNCYFYIFKNKSIKNIIDVLKFPVQQIRKQ